MAVIECFTHVTPPYTPYGFFIQHKTKLFNSSYDISYIIHAYAGIAASSLYTKNLTNVHPKSNYLMKHFTFWAVDNCKH